MTSQGPIGLKAAVVTAKDTPSVSGILKSPATDTPCYLGSFSLSIISVIEYFFSLAVCEAL